MTNNSSFAFAPWKEQGVALGNKCIWEALFTSAAIDSKDGVFLKCRYVLYLYSPSASVRKVLRRPLGLILFMGLDVGEMMRPKVQETILLLS